MVFDRQGRPETVKYHLLSTLLLNELQEQAGVVADQERRLAQQEAALLLLETRLQAFENGK